MGMAISYGMTSLHTWHLGFPKIWHVLTIVSELSHLQSFYFNTDNICPKSKYLTLFSCFPHVFFVWMKTLEITWTFVLFSISKIHPYIPSQLSTSYLYMSLTVQPVYLALYYHWWQLLRVFPSSAAQDARDSVLGILHMLCYWTMAFFSHWIPQYSFLIKSLLHTYNPHTPLNYISFNYF